MREFRRFLKTLDIEKNGSASSFSKQPRRGLVSSNSSPATIRIQTEFQLSPSLLGSQHQALKLVVATAVGVIRKFVKVR